MANNRFNKQVTPKGYKMGGRVKKMGGGMMKRPMYKKGSEVKSMYKPYNRKDLLESAGKAKERNKKQASYKSEVQRFCRFYRLVC